MTNIPKFKANNGFNQIALSFIIGIGVQNSLGIFIRESLKVNMRVKNATRKASKTLLKGDRVEE